MPRVAREVERDRMETKLERLPAQRRALRTALEAFGEDFDKRAWTHAFESDDPRDINRVLAVTGGYTALVKNTIEAIKIGAVLAGLVPTRGMNGAPAVIDAIREDDGVSAEQSEAFISLYRTRNAIQHASPDMQADEMHRQVKLLLRHLPGFVTSFVAWLERRDVTLE